ncbi:hypothetical protein F5Y19DRAFT_482132 [Xylariaceae sp. FL1651]|nr:hypothetical protein F5Y19DRAFT_482132 [Xylariaceae sp. FL1651]
MIVSSQHSFYRRSDAGESRSADVIATVATTQALSSIVLVLRLWTKLGIQHTCLAADDWAIIISWFFAAFYGIGVARRDTAQANISDLPVGIDMINSNLIFYAKQPVYYLSVSLTKFSILLFYFRLFPQKNYRIALWITMTYIILTGFACSVVSIFQCSPIRNAWDLIVPGSFINRPALFFANTGMNISQDFVIYLLPSPILWNIHLPVRQRIALIGIFILGGVVIVAGIVRVPTLHGAVTSADPTWDNYGSATV